MTELELEIKDKNDQVIRAKATSEDTCSAKDDPLAKVSKGEKVYNWAVYSGLNYWANLGISIILADVLTHGKGRKMLDRGIGNLAVGVQKASKAFTKDGIAIEKAYKQSRVGLETLSLMTGGWALLIPMKLLEDNKRPMVHWLNDKLGIDQHAPDGHMMNSDEIYIEKEQPKQSWWNVIKRRLYATAAVVGSGMALDHLAADKTVPRDKEYLLHPDKPDGIKIVEEAHLGGKERTTDLIVGGVNKGLKAIGAGSLVKDKKHWSQRYLDLAALDTVFTKMVAVIMHVTNGAGRGQAPKEIGDDAAPNVVPGVLNKLETIPDPVSHVDNARAAQAAIKQRNETPAPVAATTEEPAKSEEDCKPCKFTDALERKAPRTAALNSSPRGSYTDAAVHARQQRENSTGGMALES